VTQILNGKNGSLLKHLKNLARYGSENNFIEASKELRRKFKHEQCCKKFWQSSNHLERFT